MNLFDPNDTKKLLPAPSDRARELARAQLRDADPAKNAPAPAPLAAWIVDTLAREIDKNLPPVFRVTLARVVTRTEQATVEIEAASWEDALRTAHDRLPQFDRNCPDGVAPWGAENVDDWYVASAEDQETAQ